MKFKVARHAFFFTVALLLFALDSAHAQPSLYGKAMLSTSSGKIPLRDAVVELRKKGGEDIVARTYADDRGNFAFYDIEEGKYEIQLAINGKKLKLKVENEILEKRAVAVTGSGLNLKEVVAISE